MSEQNSDINAGLPVVEDDGLQVKDKLSVLDANKGEEAPEGVSEEGSEQKQDDSGDADHGDAAEGNADEAPEGEQGGLGEQGEQQAAGEEAEEEV